jgi:hypothetical protein
MKVGCLGLGKIGKSNRIIKSAEESRRIFSQTRLLSPALLANVDDSDGFSYFPQPQTL